MKYQIIRGDESKLQDASEAMIHDVPWGSTYTPDSRFKGIYIEGKGFLFNLCCYESNPRAEQKENYSSVCEDSCLEIFLNFAPDKSNSYINFEMNSIGTYLISIGPDRYNRFDIHTPIMPEVKARVREGIWDVTLFIPNETLYYLYGKIDFKPGYTFTGNAFKCGDKTASPHYLSWAPMQRDAMDFHRSDRFGTFEIV